MTTALITSSIVNDLDGPPEQLVSGLLDQAALMRASDLFFLNNEDHVAVSMRHLGMMRSLAQLEPDRGRRAVFHLKAMAGMDVAEHRRPLDGRWIHDGPAGRMDLRINTLPTLYGEDCAIRLLVRDFALLSLDQLGFSVGDYNELLAMLNSPGGLLLVTGPTGAGKTTTLYACLRHLNDGERKINTIEEPIEYALGGIRQSQVNTRIGLGCAELLRGVLHQAPDVIMIGEIRDPATAETAVHAANCGHLVLATLHAPIAAAAVDSIRGWGVNPHFLATSLLGVIAQRLVRTLCPECRIPFPPPDQPHTFAEVRRYLATDEGHTLYAARSCASCHQAGYASRTGVFELLHMSQALRQLIAEGRPTRAIREQALKDGMTELRQAAMLKVARGLTTAEEVVRAVPFEYLGLED
jgi:type II secretory ATPase GspE/PulE/Tfp pilus assembly ATPase PilB-like protein